MLLKRLLSAIEQTCHNISIVNSGQNNHVYNEVLEVNA